MIWDLAGSRRLGRPFAIPDNADSPRFSLRHDGRELAIGHDDGTVDADRRADAAPARELSGRRRRARSRGMGYVPALARCSPSAARTASWRSSIRRAGGRSSACRGRSGNVVTPGFSADGRLMAALSGLSTVRVYALPSGRPVSRGDPLRDRHLRHRRSARTAARSRSRARGRGVSEILDVPTLRRRATLPGLRDRCGTSCASRPTGASDGRELEGLGAAVVDRDLRSRSAASSSGTPGASTGCRSAPTAARSPPAARTARIRLWDLRTAAAARRAAARACPTASSSRSSAPDGAYLFAIYGDGAGRAYRWDVRPSSWARHACKVAGRPLTRAQWRDALPGRDYDPAC